MYVFTDRSEAGRKLAELLTKYTKQNVIILALPRGGVPVAFEIAKKLKVHLDVFVARKLASLSQPEFGIGAIAEGNICNMDWHSIRLLNLTKSNIDIIIQKEKEELNARIKKYRGNRMLPNLENMTVILVDDGVATGITASAAIKAILQKKPEKIVLATSVCSNGSVLKIKSVLRNNIDELICINCFEEFVSVGKYYKNFKQVSDEEVIKILSIFNKF